MPKEPTTQLPATVVEITTTVSYKDQKLQAAVRFDVNDLAKLVQQHGPESANTSIKTITDQLYNKTNDNIKQLINQ